MKLIYCDKKCSNNATCSNIAKYKVELCGKDVTRSRAGYRCEEHRLTTTVNCHVNRDNIAAIDQNRTHYEVNNFLRGYIGKPVPNKLHNNVIGKYVKDNGGIMCFNEKTKKWKYVYYHQIKLELFL